MNDMGKKKGEEKAYGFERDLWGLICCRVAESHDKPIHGREETQNREKYLEMTQREESPKGPKSHK